jgi:hypothetical protein
MTRRYSYYAIEKEPDLTNNILPKHILYSARTEVFMETEPWIQMIPHTYTFPIKPVVTSGKLRLMDFILSRGQFLKTGKRSL